MHEPKKHDPLQQSELKRQNDDDVVEMQEHVFPEQVNPFDVHAPPQPVLPELHAPLTHVPGGDKVVQSVQTPPPEPQAVSLVAVWQAPVTGSVHVVHVVPPVHPDPGWQVPPHPSPLPHATPAQFGVQEVVQAPLTQLPLPHTTQAAPPLPQAWTVFPG